MDKLANAVVVDACCDSCGTAAKAGDTALAIACTLGAGDFKARVAGIQDLARRSLLASHREPFRLHLTYAPAALGEVLELVAKETECCAFLDFRVRHDVRSVELTITAPESARLAADELFAHFAPQLAKVTA